MLVGGPVSGGETKVRHSWRGPFLAVELKCNQNEAATIPMNSI